MNNQTLHAHIEKLSHDGRGIARVQGKTVFIEGTLPGEEVSYIITKKHRQYDEAKALSIINAAPSRVIPKCPHAAICGGCSLQHLEPMAQLQHKQQVFLEQLFHGAKLVPEIMLPPLQGPLWQYRRKARWSVKYSAKQKTLVLGYREKNSNRIVDIQQCDVLHAPAAALIHGLKELILKLSILDYVHEVEVISSDERVALVFKKSRAFSVGDLELLKAFLDPADKPRDDETHLFYDLTKYNLRLFFQPLDFTQINWDINSQMIDLALALLDVQPNDRVLDLFCGIGNFTLPLARYAQSVVGVEGSQQAVHGAKYNALQNQITNVTLQVADLSKAFSQYAWAQQTYDKIILDPPRTGALEAIMQMGGFSAKKIVYVSCNPATFARDAKELVKMGYKLQAAGIMDMFPHTSHVESIALFTRL